MKLLFDFTVTLPSNTAVEKVLGEAIRSAESAIESLGDRTTVWIVGESTPAKTTGDTTEFFFEVRGRSTARTLLIDDLRTLKADRTARNFSEGIWALREEGPWDLLLLDHQLGELDPTKTGYGILCWLESHPECLPGKVQLVTSDQLGRERMQALLKRLYPGS